MHINNLRKYYFINKFDTKNIDKQTLNTSIIYRNYDSEDGLKTIIKLKNYCKKKGYKFLLSNNVKLAINLNLDGAYIPSFNHNFSHLSYNLNDNLLSIGTGSTVIGGSIIDSESVVVNSGTSKTIVSIGDTYHSAKVLVTIAPDVSNVSFGSTSTFNLNEFEAQELNIVHDGTDVYVSEFGTINTGSILATFTADINSGNVRILATPTSASSTVFKMYRNLIRA